MNLGQERDNPSTNPFLSTIASYLNSIFESGFMRTAAAIVYRRPLGNKKDGWNLFSLIVGNLVMSDWFLAVFL